MDTASFLAHILPDSGLYCLAEFFPSGAVKHHFFPTTQEAAQAVASIDAKQTVYHACASFKTDENRKHANVDRLKSFFLDLDVGPSKEYADLNEAKQAITHLCTTLKIHVPTIVMSGRGLHVYFVFDNSVTGEVWKAAALQFRQVLDAIKFKHDPSRTTDQASILRPVGSTWRKDGEKAVRLVHLSQPKPFGFYVETFNRFMRDNNITPQIMPTTLANSMFKVEQLGTQVEYPPSSVITVASMCAQLARMRDLRGAVSEPEWRNAIGVIKHCTEGSVIAHEWSKGDPRYDEKQTQDKLDRWETGPTTCEQFERTNSHICATCKFKGQIRSPIQLGYTDKVEAPEALKVPENVQAADIDLTQFWPDGFQWFPNERKLKKLIRVKDQAPEWVSFCGSLFYPTMRIQLSDGTWAQRIMMEVTPGRYREFDIPTKLLASQDSLCSALAAYEVVIEQRKGHMAVTFLDNIREKMQRAQLEMRQHDSFGWVSNETAFDGFVIGTNLVRADGRDSKVILDNELQHNREIHEGVLCKGSDTEWARILNQAYNRPGAEVYQFTIMALLSAPVVKLLGADQWHGIPIGLTGASGQGKTTVGRAATSAYGPADMFMFKANAATAGAPDPFLGMLHNLPVVLDEYTGKDPVQVSDRLYAMSNGHGMIRMNQKGKLSEVRHRWDTTMLVTGNSNINEAMATLSKSRSEAGNVRVFEYVFQGNESSKIFGNENIQDLIEHQLAQHYGVAGRKALRVMMANVQSIRNKFQELRTKYGFNSQGFDSKERYFVDLIATAEIGGKIFQKLGYIQWDVDHVISWARNHMQTLRTLRNETMYSTDDKVAQFIGSLAGHILVTRTWGRTNETGLENYPLRGEVRARMAINDQKFFVSKRVFDEWCRGQHIQPSALLSELVEAKYVLATPEARQILTKGTNMPLARQRIIEFDYNMISATAKVDEGKVVSIA